MEIGLGNRYTVTANNITVPITSGVSGNAFDMVNLATSSTVPIIIDRIVMTASVTAGQIQQVQVMRRSTGGTGGTGVTARPTNASAQTAATTCSYLLVTTVGTAGAIIDSQEWNLFAPYEFNMRPGGLLVPVSSYVSIFCPAPSSSTYPASFTVEFIELV